LLCPCRTQNFFPLTRGKEERQCPPNGREDLQKRGGYETHVYNGGGNAYSLLARERGRSDVPPGSNEKEKKKERPKEKTQYHPQKRKRRRETNLKMFQKMAAKLFRAQGKLKKRGQK